MINIVKKIFDYKDNNVLLYGDYHNYHTNVIPLICDISKLRDYTYEGFPYKYKDDIYHINLRINNKYDNLLHSIFNKVNYFSDKKRIIIIDHVDYIPRNNIMRLTYLLLNQPSTFFILFTSKVSSIRELYVQCVCVRLPTTKHSTKFHDRAAYDKIMHMYKNKNKKCFLQEKNDIVYHFHCLSDSSVELQKLLVSEICKNSRIPNNIKYKIYEGVSHINHLYSNSYTKNIYLEYCIMFIYKYIEDYIDIL